MALLTERTTFTLDVLGRYTANTWQEVIDSQNQALDPHARPFDVFIIGGGTFGPALASRLFSNDHTRARRILLIEAGPLALPEHVQNLPSLGTDEVWGVPWNSDSPLPQDRSFPGLAYCLGGRSVFWGGWSPHFLPGEIPTPPWPATTRDDLLQPVLTIPAATPTGVRQLSYLDLAAEQIGAADPNDFISGAPHEAMRTLLFTGLTGRAGGATTPTGSRGALAGQADLEAPLAVESTSPRPGFLPFNKFSVVPLLVRVSRLANDENVLPNKQRPQTVYGARQHPRHRPGRRRRPHHPHPYQPRRPGRATQRADLPRSGHDREHPHGAQHPRPRPRLRPAPAHRPQPHGPHAVQPHLPRAPRRFRPSARRHAAS